MNSMRTSGIIIRGRMGQLSIRARQTLRAAKRMKAMGNSVFDVIAALRTLLVLSPVAQAWMANAAKDAFPTARRAMK